MFIPPKKYFFDKKTRAWAEIDAQALAHNIGLLQRLGPDVMAAVKADAYGHGLDLIVPASLGNGVRHFAVATVEEAVDVRRILNEQSCSDAKVYLMAAVLASASEVEAIVQEGFVPFVTDFAFAQALAGEAVRQGTSVEIHIEVNTGIGRAGIPPEEAADFLIACDKLPGVHVTGLCTHFTAADAETSADALGQYELFEKVLQSLPLERVNALQIHAANSPATLRVPLGRYAFIRPGLLLYGIAPSMGLIQDFAYRPVLSLYALALLVRRLPQGADISYSRTYTLPHDATIATIGIGYGDGFPRRLSNCGEVLLLDGTRCPIRGRVCMDQICVELPDGAQLMPGDRVVLLGQAGGHSITTTQVAEQIDTTPHEITTCLTKRIPRILKEAE